MNHVCNLLTAAAMGAGLIYFFDPVSGRRRRGLLRDQLIHGMTKSRKVAKRADARYRDVKNRAYGTYHELRRDAQNVMEAATGHSR
jgi:hypothetical protein